MRMKSKSAWRSLCKVWSRKDQLPTHQICIVFLEPQMKLHLVLVINENLFFLLYYSLRSPKEVRCQLPIAQKWWENRSVYFIRLHSQLHGFQGWESFPRSNLSNRQNTVFQATPSQPFKDRVLFRTRLVGLIVSFLRILCDTSPRPFLSSDPGGANSQSVAADQPNLNITWESNWGSSLNCPPTPTLLSTWKRRKYIENSAHLTVTPASKLRKLHFFLDTLVHN